MHDFHEESLEILIYVFFITPDWETELKEREKFILKIMELAEKLNIKFAYVKHNKTTLNLENGKDSKNEFKNLNYPQE